MTNDAILCGALAPLSLPVAELVYHGDAEDYITYTLIAERPAAQADDEETETVAEYYVTLHLRQPPGPLKRRAKRLLKAAGIGVDSVTQVSFEDGARERFTLNFDCFILNDETEDGET